MHTGYRKTGYIFILTGLLAGCGASHRLAEYQFRDLTATAIIAAPGAADISVDRPVVVNPDDPIAAAIRVGTTIAKHAQLAQTRARLDSALRTADLPQRVKLRILSRGADYLHYTPTEKSQEADLLFDIRIERYGLNAESWRSRVLFHLELTVLLIDNKKGTLVWERQVREHMPVNSSFFGMSGPVGDIVTTVRLSQLSTEELVQGLFNLADYTTDRVVNELKEDYLEIRTP